MTKMFSLSRTFRAGKDSGILTGKAAAPFRTDLSPIVRLAPDRDPRGYRRCLRDPRSGEQSPGSRRRSVADPDLTDYGWCWPDESRDSWRRPRWPDG